MNDRLELYSPFPPEECARRISDAIDIERSIIFTLTSLFGTHAVAGRVKDSSFRLRKRIRYNNSFQTFLTATMQPHDTGTIIRGKFAMLAFTRIFMRIWFGGVALFGAAGFLSTLIAAFTHPKTLEIRSLLFLIFPMGMLLFGYLLVRLGRYLARDEATFLTGFLRQTLDAQEQPGGSY